MMHSDSPEADKLYECESNYLAFTHIFLYFLTEFFYVLYEEQEISDVHKEKLERQLLLSLSSLEKMHYHFFHQKDLLDEIYFCADTSIVLLHDDKEYVKKDIRGQISELKKQIQQHPFVLDSLKIRCLDYLYLLLSYYPNVTIINNTAPHPPWLSISR